MNKKMTDSECEIRGKYLEIILKKSVISMSVPKQSQIATKLIARSPKSQLSRVLTGTSEDGCSSFCNCGDFSVPTTVAGLSIVDVITGLWKSDV